MKRMPPRFATRTEVKRTLYALKAHTGNSAISLGAAFCETYYVSKNLRDQLITMNDGDAIQTVYTFFSMGTPVKPMRFFKPIAKNQVKS